jgi:hypothetical protein
MITMMRFHSRRISHSVETGTAISMTRWITMVISVVIPVYMMFIMTISVPAGILIPVVIVIRIIVIHDMSVWRIIFIRRDRKVVSLRQTENIERRTRRNQIDQSVGVSVLVIVILRIKRT